jgi:hypothetical protein
VYATEAASPLAEASIPGACGRDLQLADSSPESVESDANVLLLVGVDSDDDFVSLQCDA